MTTATPVRRPGRVEPVRRTGTVAQLLVFGAIGVASTVLHLGGFVLLRQVAPSQLANAVALLVAAVANTWANRRWTFGVRGRDGAARHQVQGLLVFALTLAMTSGGLALLGTVAPSAPTWVETVVVAVTNALATAVKYVAMRWWVFRPVPSAAGSADQRTGPTPGSNHSASKPPSRSVKRTTT